MVEIVLVFGLWNPLNSSLRIEDFLLNPWVVGPLVAYMAMGYDFRAVTLIPIPSIPLASSYVRSIDSSTIFPFYIACWLSIFAGVDFSNGDMNAWMKNGHRYLRQSLRPFAMVQLLARKIFRAHQRGVSAILIPIMSLVISSAIPVLISVLLPVNLTPDILLYAGVAYLLLVREEAAKGAEHLFQKQ